MCTDPNHMNEFKEIAGSIVRMETKLDNVLNAVSDHEARIRVAETAIIVHNDNKTETDAMKLQISALQSQSALDGQTIGAWKKILWIIATAAFGGLGLSIWDAFKRGGV